MEIKGTQLRYNLIDFKKVVTMTSLTLSEYCQTRTGKLEKGIHGKAMPIEDEPNILKCTNTGT